MTSPAESPPLPDTHLSARVLSVDPLVTISSTNSAVPLGLSSVGADLLNGRPALHLLHPTWTLEQGDAPMLTAAMRQARADLPESRFVLLAANDTENLLVQSLGEPVMVANGLIFIDERIWRPVPPAGPERFDAVYVARLDPEKRHELAAGIERLELIYGYELSGGGGLERIRRTMPSARLVNHEIGKGHYAYLEPTQVAALMAQASVGLCLSAVEGCMRASMEYLLSGLPVVSTRSIGGRDRYFVGGYCAVVDADPDAVAAAVRSLAARNLDRARIRAHIGEIIAFERHNFLMAVNGLARTSFGVERLFPRFSPFLGAVATMRHARDHRAMLAAALDGRPS